jgi:hypothetical protein
MAQEIIHAGEEIINNKNSKVSEVETVKVSQTKIDDLPKSSSDQSNEGSYKVQPDPSSPITNINQKLQDAMSSFFKKFKKP